MSWLGQAIGAAKKLVGARKSGRPLRAAELQVAADVDGAMLSSAAALRRLGATITRYETDAGRVEARARTDDGHGRISLTITGEGESLARMRIESDVADARQFFRRFKRELGRKETT